MAAEEVQDPTQRSRRWLFTMYHGVDWMYDHAVEMCESKKELFRYLVFQKEKCPTTDREHIQGYCELFSDRQRKSFQSLFPESGLFNCRPAKATSEQNKAYCTKEESRLRAPVEWGTPSQPGKRTDLESVVAAVVEGKTLTAIAREFPATFIRNGRGIKDYMMQTQRPRSRASPVIRYLHGPPGIGKSVLARHLLKTEFGDDFYEAMDMKESWFDGYMGERAMIFDEFCGQFPLGNMLKLLSEGPLRMPYKGSFHSVNVEVFFFTSNKHPRDVYYGSDVFQASAWLDRIGLGEKPRFKDVQVWGPEDIRRKLSDLGIKLWNESL